MCNPISGVYSRSRDETFYLPTVHAHETIIDFYQLADDKDDLQRFEMGPQSAQHWPDPDKWLFEFDLKQPWADYDLAEKLETHCRERFRPNVLTSGTYIIGGDANVRDIENAYIIYIGGHAKITYIGLCANIHDIAENAEITEANNNPSISTIRDNATIHRLQGHAIVWEIRDQATIDIADDDSHITVLTDATRIHRLDGHAVVHTIGVDATIDYAGPDAQVRNFSPRLPGLPNPITEDARKTK